MEKLPPVRYKSPLVNRKYQFVETQSNIKHSPRIITFDQSVKEKIVQKNKMMAFKQNLVTLKRLRDSSKILKSPLIPFSNPFSP